MHQYQAQKLITISSCIDDISPELLPQVIDKLILAGAKDAFLTPIIMKKGRPGFKLEALCEEGLRDELLDLIFKETSTIGVKINEISRVELRRKEVVINVKGESIRVKLAYLPNNGLVNIKPEFDDCLAASERLNLPLKEILRYANALAIDA